MGVGEPRAFRGDTEVAAQRPFQAAGHGRPVDRTDQRLGGLQNLVKGQFIPVRGCAEPALAHRDEVQTGAEGRVRAREHDRPDVIPGVEVDYRRAQLLDQLRSDRVTDVGAVQRDNRCGCAYID